jgi:hypothetical protein
MGNSGLPVAVLPGGPGLRFATSCPQDNVMSRKIKQMRNNAGWVRVSPAFESVMWYDEYGRSSLFNDPE